MAALMSALICSAVGRSMGPSISGSNMLGDELIMGVGLVGCQGHNTI